MVRLLAAAAARYTYATTLVYSTGDIPEVEEIEVEVSFTVAWGSPGTGRPYYGPPENYDEGAPAEIEDLRLELVNGTKRPDPFDASGAGAVNQEYEAAILQEIAQNHMEAMILSAIEAEEARRDD